MRKKGTIRGPSETPELMREFWRRVSKGESLVEVFRFFIMEAPSPVLHRFLAEHYGIHFSVQDARELLLSRRCNPQWKKERGSEPYLP